MFVVWRTTGSRTRVSDLRRPVVIGYWEGLRRSPPNREGHFKDYVLTDVFRTSCATVF